MKIINNEITSRQEFNQLYEERKFLLPKGLYAIAIISFEKNLNTKESSFARNLVKAELNQYFESLIVYKKFRNSLFVLTSGSLDSYDLILDCLDKIVEMLKKEDFFINIGCGAKQKDFSNLYISYQQAEIALEQAINNNLKKLKYNESLDKKIGSTNYLKTELDMLQKYALTGNKAKVLAIIKSFYENHFLEDNKIYFARIVCYEILNTLHKAFQKINPETNILKVCYIELISISTIRSVEELKKVILHIHEVVIEYFDNANYRTAEDIIINYVESNYMDYTFSITNMAKDLNLPVSKLNNYFKEHLGHTPLEYINLLRIEKAKQLLISTDLKIKEITKTIGYIDESSFIKKFRKNVLMTPGEYRKAYLVKKKL